MRRIGHVPEQTLQEESDPLTQTNTTQLAPNNRTKHNTSRTSKFRCFKSTRNATTASESTRSPIFHDMGMGRAFQTAPCVQATHSRRARAKSLLFMVLCVCCSRRHRHNREPSQLKPYTTSNRTTAHESRTNLLTSIDRGGSCRSFRFSCGISRPHEFRSSWRSFAATR